MKKILFIISLFFTYHYVIGQRITILSPVANQRISSETEFDIVFNVENDNFGTSNPRFMAFICSDINNPSSYAYLGYSYNKGAMRVKVPSGYDGNFWTTVQANSPTSSTFPFGNIVVPTQHILVSIVPKSKNVRYFEFTTKCGHNKWQDSSFIAATSNQIVINDVLSELAKPIKERKFINGRITNGNGGHNHNANFWFHWHFIPSQWELVSNSIEVCDGCPYSDVEADTAGWINNIGRFCPWNGKPAREILDPSKLSIPSMGRKITLKVSALFKNEIIEITDYEKNNTGRILWTEGGITNQFELLKITKSLEGCIQFWMKFNTFNLKGSMYQENNLLIINTGGTIHSFNADSAEMSKFLTFVEKMKVLVINSCFTTNFEK